MIKKMYTIRDAKAEIFHPPFYCLTHGEAERHFATTARNQESMVAKYPEDYALYYLGTFNDVQGTFETLDTPQHMQNAIAISSQFKPEIAQ